MNEPNFNKLTPIHYLMIVTAIFFHFLNIFLRFKWNISANHFWQFIHLGCTLSLFAWLFYAGIVYGKHLTFNLITNLKVILKKLEADLEISKQENMSSQERLGDLQNNFDVEIGNLQKIELSHLAKLKKYEQTAEEANRNALKNFI